MYGDMAIYAAITAARLMVCGIAAMIIHEGGHYAAALCFGHRIKFRFAFGKLWKIPVPRYVWNMPDIDRRKQRVIALAGFVTEFASALACFLLLPDIWLWYPGVAAAHFMLYPFYAGGANDFKWIRR